MRLKDNNGKMDQAMKRIKALGLTVLLATAWNGSVTAQGWFPIGATWTYNYADQLFTGYVTHVVTGDSVIDGHACRVIDVVRTYGYGQNVYTAQLAPFCVYDSAGLSFIHVPGAGFDTLYNMNAEIGDRWHLAPVPEQFDSTSYVEVMDTGSMVMDGVALRWLAVTMVSPMLSWVLQDTIVERLGSLVSYLPPQNSWLAALDGSEGGSLRCYQDADINFRASWADVCEIALGMADHPLLGDQLRLYPNPGSELLQLEGLFHGVADVLVTDATSRTTARVFMQTGMSELNTATWVPGLYQVRIITDEWSRTLKWMKQ